MSALLQDLFNLNVFFINLILGQYYFMTKRTCKLWRRAMSTGRLFPGIRKGLFRRSPRWVPAYKDFPDMCCDVSLFLNRKQLQTT